MTTEIPSQAPPTVPTSHDHTIDVQCQKCGSVTQVLASYRDEFDEMSAEVEKLRNEIWRLNWIIRNVPHSSS